MTMATSADPQPRSSKRVSELRLADTEMSSPNRQTCSSFPLPRGTSIMSFCASCSNTSPSQTQLFPEPPTESCGARERLRRLKVNHGSWFGYPQTPESSRVLQCLVDVQAQLGGDSPIGRRL